MIKDCVLVIGSGKSILDLSKVERDMLNICEVKIGINKYAAFYEQVGILPTHVYYHDDHYESSRLFFEYLVKKLRKNRLKDISFIVSKTTSEFLTQSFFNYFLNNLIRRIKSCIYKILNESQSKRNYILLPKNSKIESINIRYFTKRNTPWAKSLNESLYHFKGSFSTILNYISISYPNKTILLIGVDFNSSDYFFENDLEKLKFNTKDWTYELRKNQDKHYSIIETDGVKMDDELPFMIRELEKTNNKLYSLSNLSYLVEKGYVESINLDEIICKSV